jgi:hypothetical protein
LKREGAGSITIADALELCTVTADEILAIYDVLVRDFAEDSDPISPAGVASHDLLNSAVGRQHTGSTMSDAR